MRSAVCQTSWLVLVGSLLLACGGHLSRDSNDRETPDVTGTSGGASSSAGTLASAGATNAGTGASGGTASDGLLALPNTVTLVSPSGDAQGVATPSMIGP